MTRQQQFVNKQLTMKSSDIRQHAQQRQRQLQQQLQQYLHYG